MSPAHLNNIFILYIQYIDLNIKQTMLVYDSDIKNKMLVLSLGIHLANLPTEHIS